MFMYVFFVVWEKDGTVLDEVRCASDAPYIVVEGRVAAYVAALEDRAEWPVGTWGIRLATTKQASGTFIL